MAELCQKPPVVFEIDTEKNGYAEHKLPVGYWIENIVTGGYSLRSTRIFSKEFVC
jgi:hypothetical protein